MPLITRKKILAAKIESTSGTVESLANADAAFNAFDLNIQGSFNINERMQQGSFSRLPSTVGARQGTLSFSTELFGDGAAGPPGWASTLFPACGWVESTGTFSPTSESPGSNVKTVTIGIYEDGKRKLLRGAAGTFRLILPAGEPAMIEWTFTGVWQAPTDVALLTPTYPTIIPLRFGNATFTVGGSDPGCVSSVEIDAGNNVIMRECPTSSDGSGFSTAIITDRRVSGSMDPESQLVASNDVFGKWLAGTEEALSIVLTDGTDTVTIAAPQIQHINVQEGDRNGLQTDQIEFQCNASTGDDELTIDFS